MVVASVSSPGRGSPDAGNADRFYCPPPIRCQQLLLLQQQQRQEQRHSPVEHNSPPPPATEAETAPDPDVSSSKPSVSSSSSSMSSSSSSSSSSSPRSLLPAGNLERFLKSTTPIVPGRYSSKACDGWNGESSTGPPPYFELGDLWDSFREWSAYGVGVPLVLNGGVAVVQYYVPFLSAIELYADIRRPACESRCSDEKGDIKNNQDTSSKFSVEINQGSLKNAGQEGLQLPVFQYMEHDPPYGRLPLADKISVLAKKNSRISEVNDISNIQNNNGVEEISLPTFGLASYKFNFSVWISNGLSEQQLSSSLMQAADDWLQLRHVDHPDYQFFLSHYNSSCK